jgi:CBS domain-containing protein
MIAIDKICNRQVVAVARGAKVTEAARMMRSHHVGDVVLVEDRDGKRVPCGILTDRDIAIAVVAEGIDPDEVSVGEVVRADVVTGSSEASVAEIVESMRRHGVRRIPIVDKQGELAGIVTADDVVEFVAREMAAAADLSQQRSAGEPRTSAELAASAAEDGFRYLTREIVALAKMILREQKQEVEQRPIR